MYNFFVQTCQKITTTRNSYGDFVDGAHTNLSCRFRWILREDRGVHIDELDADAMVWFPTGTDIALGDVIIYQSYRFKVEKLIEARKLYKSTIEFIKCEVKVIQIAEIS